MTARTRLLAVLWAAGAVSVACNVLAAEPSAVGRGVAAWPPLALLLVVEVLARSPLPTGRARWATVSGATSVAAVAAVASFHHMHEVAASVGESQLVAYLFPLSVDGLAVVASVALLGTHTRTAPTRRAAPATNRGEPAIAPSSVAPVEPAVLTVDDPPAVVPAPVALFVSPMSGTRVPASNGAGVNNNHAHNNWR
jgi:hypothetical protein